ncbi:uncharacterized protein Dere_GG24191 [Drosophila erecta]|uniref:Uncharacterized protein n=1 Tax=Drosophila erecta TaxID=7220 RepID=B3N618_DROER|nr:uncharacterized protein Dere_GG24191 [Drosophila erecta]
MSSQQNLTPPGNSTPKKTVRKIPEESSISTVHPVATSTPTYMTRNRQRLLSLQMDSNAFISKNSSLVDRVPPTFEHIRGRKGIHDPSTPKTPVFPRTRSRNLPNTPVRATSNKNTPKPKTPAQKKKTPAKTPKKTQKTTQNIAALNSPTMNPESPAVESHIDSTEMSLKILPSKPSKELSIEEPVKLPTISSKMSLMISSVKSALKRKVSCEENSPEEVSDKENSAAEDSSESPLKKARLNIFQVNLGSPFSMIRSKKLKLISADENQESYEAPPVNLGQINTSTNVLGCS